MAKSTYVIIDVRSGCAAVTRTSPGVEVFVRDWDNMGQPEGVEDALSFVREAASAGLPLRVYEELVGPVVRDVLKSTMDQFPMIGG
jgi:hypothetical protein